MSKSRVSLTVDEDLLKRIDAEADRSGLNRSQMFEDIVKNYIHGQKIDTAVVFCGGEELNALNEVDGKPILAHVMDHLKQNNISRVIILAGPNEDRVKSRFAWGDGLNIDFVSESDHSGTADALKKLEDRIGKTFLAVNGDVIADVDVSDMLKVHRDEGCEATMALTTVEDPSSYGAVHLKGRKVLRFKEKPEPGEEPTKLVNAGTYIFEPSIFDNLSDNGLDQVFSDLAAKGNVSGYIYGGKWEKP